MKQLNFTLIIMLGLFSCNMPADSKDSMTDTSKVEDPVSYYTQQQMDQVLKFRLDSVIKSNGSPLLANEVLGFSKEHAPYLVNMRAGPGWVEMHELWDDVAIIRSGHGILRTGYHVNGEQQRMKGSSSDWIGGTILDGKERYLSPGDFIIIPAMLAHQYIPGSGDTLTYWTIKVKRPK